MRDLSHADPVYRVRVSRAVGERSQVHGLGGGSSLRVNIHTACVLSREPRIQADRTPVGKIEASVFENLGRSSRGSRCLERRKSVLATRAHGDRLARRRPTHLDLMGRVQLAEAYTVDSHDVRKVAVFGRRRRGVMHSEVMPAFEAQPKGSQAPAFWPAICNGPMTSPEISIWSWLISL